MPAASRGLQFHPHQELLSANFPLPGCRALCLVCLWLAALSCARNGALPSRGLRAGTRALEACRDNQDMSPDCLILLLPFGLCRGISRGELVLADTPLARAQCPGKLEGFQDFQVT